MRQIRVDAKLPRVPESPDHLWFLGEIVVLPVLHVALAHKGLEVGAVLDPIGRVDVDHLHLAAQAFLLQEAVHHEQTVTGDQTVGPVVLVLVELDGLAKRRVLFRSLEQRELRMVPVALLHRVDDGARVDALVNMQRDGRDIERGMFGLRCPDKLRVKVRIVGVGFLVLILVCIWRYKPDRGVVEPLLVGVGVVPDIAFPGFGNLPNENLR